MSQPSDLRFNEKCILELSMKNKLLQKKIDINNAEIDVLRNYNRELKGRPVSNDWTPEEILRREG